MFARHWTVRGNAAAAKNTSITHTATYDAYVPDVRRIYRLGREADIKEINVIDRILHQIILDDVRSAIHRADAIRSAKPSSDAKNIHGAICYGNPDFSLHTFLRTVLMEVGEI